MTIRPSSGDCSPAMQSSTVVLPAPEAPNRIVNPAETASSTSSVKFCPLSRRKLFSIRAVNCSFCVAIGRRSSPSPHAPSPACAAGIEDRQHGEAERQQNERGAVCRCVIERLHLVVNQNGDRLRCAGNIAADHEHHAELAQGVRETQNHPGQHARQSQRQHDAPERAPSRMLPEGRMRPAICGRWQQTKWPSAAPRRAGCTKPIPAPGLRR